MQTEIYRFINNILLLDILYCSFIVLKKWYKLLFYQNNRIKCIYRVYD